MGLKVWIGSQADVERVLRVLARRRERRRRAVPAGSERRRSA